MLQQSLFSYRCLNLDLMPIRATSLLCPWSKTKICHICKKKRWMLHVSIGLQWNVPVRLFWFRHQPARTSPACHETLQAQRHMPQPCKLDFYTHRQNEIIFCHWDYSRQAFMLCLSPARARAALLYIQEKSKKRSRLLSFTYGAEWAQPGLAHYSNRSPPKRVLMERETNCLLGCSFK